MSREAGHRPLHSTSGRRQRLNAECNRLRPNGVGLGRILPIWELRHRQWQKLQRQQLLHRRRTCSKRMHWKIEMAARGTRNVFTREKKLIIRAAIGERC